MARKIDPNRAKEATKRPVGRPRKISAERMVVTGQMMATATPSRSGGVYFLPVDEILMRKGWRTYKDMRHDDQVRACLAFKKILVHGRTWELKPGKDTEQAKKIAKFVEWSLRRINFKDVIKNALSAFDFGFSAGEITWEVAEWDGEQALTVKSIKHRDPEHVEIKMDVHGNVLGFRQNDYGGQIELEPHEVLYYAHNAEFGNAYGVSDLRGAYRSWWAKKFIINFWNVYLERMGSPMTLMKYPVGSSDELKGTLKGILTSLSTKQEVLVPEGVEVELVEAQRSGNPSYNEALKYHNNSIARALLMVALLGMGGKDDGLAAESQSHLHLRILFKMADEVSQDLMFAFNEQVIKPLVDMNFTHDDEYPHFIWQDYGQFEGREVADTIRLLHAAGILDMDQSDVNYARSILGLPLRGEDDKEDEVVRPQPLPPPADANKVPPKAGAGNEKAKSGGDSTGRAARGAQR